MESRIKTYTSQVPAVKQGSGPHNLKASSTHTIALGSVTFHPEPFGEELFVGQNGRSISQGYTGDNVRQRFTQKKRNIETGLEYFGARRYSSTIRPIHKH
ncbi:MAG TPA: hypothetical protein VJ124_10140 [Pyrinomonadaceae bacterium]|nr:hypothetical protein [Pyrinomonadaceae bacterium]